MHTHTHTNAEEWRLLLVSRLDSELPVAAPFFVKDATVPKVATG